MHVLLRVHGSDEVDLPKLRRGIGKEATEAKTSVIAVEPPRSGGLQTAEERLVMRLTQNAESDWGQPHGGLESAAP